eukprot:GHVU01211867.1.p1 GENE.GHVU01211867.1~~GHVU01211867.1.p1  ORF type:complete len:121 (-),score=18.31 GHVU01211867.1:576-938(-)
MREAGRAGKARERVSQRVMTGRSDSGERGEMHACRPDARTVGRRFSGGGRVRERPNKGNEGRKEGRKERWNERMKEGRKEGGREERWYTRTEDHLRLCLFLPRFVHSSCCLFIYLSIPSL